MVSRLRHWWRKVRVKKDPAFPDPLTGYANYSERQGKLPAQGPHGVELFYRFFEPKGYRVDKAKGVGVMLSDWNTHSLYFRPFASYLIEKGYCAYGVDLRGQGYSGGKRGHVDRFGDYLEDLERVLEEVHRLHPRLGLYLVGLGLSSLVIIRYLERSSLASAKKYVRGVVLANPLFDLSLLLPSRTKKAIGRVIGEIAPNLSLRDRIKISDLTSDPEWQKFIDADPLLHQSMTAKWLKIIRRETALAMEESAFLTDPFLLLSGGRDPFSSMEEHIEPFFARIRSRIKYLYYYPDAAHHLFIEKDNLKIFATIQSFLDSLHR